MSFLKKLDLYVHEAAKLRKAYPGRFDMRQLVAYFPSWRRSLTPGAGPLLDRSPWITFSAKRFLEENINPTMRVFEYGAGGSTLFFAARVREVVSVEHNPDWSRKTIDALKISGLKNWRVLLCEPQPDPQSSSKDRADPNAYISDDAHFHGKSFKDYVQKIQEYEAGYFDLIFIDGRARPSCFALALKSVKRPGLILWDNTDRDYYAPAMQLASASFEFIDFPGPLPYVPAFGRTSVWRCF